MKHTKYITHEQYAINNKALRDTARTDSWLKQNGLNVDAVATVCGEVLIAQKKAHEILTQHAKLLSPEQKQLLTAFEEKLSDKKKRKKLRPSSAYPILNLCLKITRQAYRNEMLAKQKIQALRQKQQ